MRITYLLWLFFIPAFGDFAHGDELTIVKIGSVVPLDLTDTEYSERYRIGYQGAIFFAAGELSEKIKKCGYKLEFDFRYYQESKKIEAARQGKELEIQGSWMVLGPSRSSHFIVLNKALLETPHLSALASAGEVMELSPPAFTMYPSNGELVNGLKKSILKEKYGNNYGIALDPGCLYCRNFSSEFKKHFGNPKFEVEIDPNSTNFTELDSNLKKYKVSFLLLPNYSKASGITLASVENKFKNIAFVGGAGWGDGTYGYLTKISLPKAAKGISIRLGGRPKQIAESLKLESLSFRWKGTPIYPASSALLLVEALRKISNQLCSWKPKDKTSYVEKLTSAKKDLFRSTMPLSIFKLQNGTLEFAYESE